MKKKITLSILVLVLVALFVPTTAQAKEAFDDKVVFGGTFTLDSGETHEGSLVVFGGAVTLEDGSMVNGDVVLMGGTVEVGGTVHGSVVGIGGAVRLNEGADIYGDLFTLGAALRREEGASVRGQVINGFDLAENVTLPEELGGDDFTPPTPPSVNINPNPILEVIWFFFRIFMYAALAVIVVMFLPKHVDRIAQAAVSQPVMTAGAGLLTAVLAPLALLAITITIILIPVTLVAILALFAAWLVGWIALGAELGQRITKAINMEWAPAISAGVGTFILFFVFGGFRQLIPCIGWIPHLLISFWGLGAVLMTRFGTQDYVPSGDGQQVEPERMVKVLPEEVVEPVEDQQQQKSEETPPEPIGDEEDQPTEG